MFQSSVSSELLCRHAVPSPEALLCVASFVSVDELKRTSVVKEIHGECCLQFEVEDERCVRVIQWVAGFISDNFGLCDQRGLLDIVVMERNSGLVY